MNYGLIGCGMIAAKHIEAAKANGLKIVAVCDIFPESMDRLLAAHDLEGQGIKKYTDYREMLAENDLDLVALCTVTNIRPGICMDCINAGVNVIIEKPIAMSMRDADEIVALAKAKGVKVGVCHQYRLNTAVQQLHQALSEGKLGRISHGTAHIRWNRNKAYYDQAAWRGTWDKDGGTLANQCIHFIDILVWLMGKPIEVYAQARNRLHDEIEIEDVCVATVTFESGAVATIEGTVNVYPKNLESSIYIFGEKGTVKLGGRAADVVEYWNVKDYSPEQAEPFAFGEGHTGFYADMIDAIEHGRAPYIDALAGRNALELVMGIYKSVKEHRPVRFPVTEFACTDMKSWDGN